MGGGILIRLAPWAILAALIGLAIWYVQDLQADLAEARAGEVWWRSEAEAQSAAVGILTETRARVQEVARDHDLALRRLEGQRRQLAKDLAEVRRQDPVERDWSVSGHPFGVGERMRALAAPAAPAGTDPHSAELAVPGTH